MALPAGAAARAAPDPWATLRPQDALGGPWARAALLAVAVASFVVFVGFEALARRIPIWYAQNVVTLGQVALYAVIPEILLGLATFRVFEATASRPLHVRLAGAVALMLFYLGALLVFYFLMEGVA